eukprot:TRINITY_DN4989_c1_g2_i2.p1 TRINITY_DN4989_c1_g2~~TRINITY_DN4989_c1_g2_i2.p1  ORF type:complete len:638 (+),score=261.82 TRINITY_DN4989_c1_g2_i2:47-1960(+)
MTDYNSWTVSKIKEELESLGVTTSGKKKILITKLKKEKGEEYSYDNWTGKELKAELKSRGLSQAGNKTLLIERLENHDENGDDMEEEPIVKTTKAKPKPKKKKAPPPRKSTRKRKKVESYDDDEQEEEEVVPPPKKKVKLSPQKKIKEKPAKKETKAEHKTKMKHAKLDQYCDELSNINTEVIEDVMLNQTNITNGRNNNKFYVIQVLKSGGFFYTWTRWGRIGEKGRGKMFGPFYDEEGAMNVHDKKMKEKTVKGDYIKIELAYGAEEEEMDMKFDSISTNATVLPCTLDDRTQSLLRLLFDHDMFKSQMKKLNINVEKMPLGKLSKNQIQKGYDVLSEIKTCLDEGDNSRSTLSELSSQFFSLIPHAFGRSRPPVIDNFEFLQEKMDLMSILGDIEIATSLEKKSGSQISMDLDEIPHPLDQKYSQLGSRLTLVDKKSKEFKIIDKFVKGTKNGSMSIIDVFEVDRNGEDERFQSHEDLGNRKLLWHGTNVAVVAAILNGGLRIMPHSGGRVGRGIYFASEHSKSAGYVACAENTGIMFLNEVALGKEHHILNDDWTLRNPPPGFDSIVALGRTEPDPKNDTTIEIDGNEITVPQGPVINMNMNGRNNSSFYQSEYLIYKESQCRIRYLLKFKWY